MCIYAAVQDQINAVLKYLSARSGKTVAMILSFPYFSAICFAAHTLAPEEVPTSRPCTLASSRAELMASSSVTSMMSVMIEVSRISGIKPSPIPWIWCRPGSSPSRAETFFGSTAAILQSGVLLEKILCHALQGPAASYAGYEDVYFLLQLPDQLDRRRPVMHLRIGRILKLLRDKEIR